MADQSPRNNLDAVSDAALAREVRNGSDAAFEEITRRYQGLIGSIATRYCAAGFDHADFMQEGLMALHSACKAYRNRCDSASFRNFAAVCISNRFLSVIRSAAAKSVIPGDAIVSYDDIELSDNNTLNPEKLIVDKENTEALHKLLRDKLSPLEFDVLRLYLWGISYTDIAKKLSVSTKSVDNALQRIRRKIADYHK